MNLDFEIAVDQKEGTGPMTELLRGSKLPIPNIERRAAMRAQMPKFGRHILKISGKNIER